MTKRFAPVVIAGLTLIGCASPAPSEELAMDAELSQTWQALTVFECQAQNAECIVEAGFDLSDQALCATELTDCIVDQAVDSTTTIVGCGFEDVGCTLEGAAALDLSDIVDCQQEVLDCTVAEVDAISGVDLAPITEPVNEIVDDVVGDVEDVVEDGLDNVRSQLDCNVEAAECLSGNIFNFSAVRECRNAFIECSANVVEDVIEDAVDVITGTLDCAGVYAECRADGGSVLVCASERRACENSGGN